MFKVARLLDGRAHAALARGGDRGPAQDRAVPVRRIRRVHPREDRGAAARRQDRLPRGLRAGLPKGLLEMLDVPGLGPKKVKAITTSSRSPRSPSSSRRARTAASPRSAVRREDAGEGPRRDREPDRRRGRASSTARPRPRALCAALAPLRSASRSPAASGGGARACATSSPRRLPTTPSRSMEAVREATASRRLGRGKTKTSGAVRGGLQVDVRVVAPQQFARGGTYFKRARKSSTSRSG